MLGKSLRPVRWQSRRMGRQLAHVLRLQLVPAAYARRGRATASRRGPTKAVQLSLRERVV